jgi:hypothetical protein
LTLEGGFAPAYRDAFQIASQGKPQEIAGLGNMLQEIRPGYSESRLLSACSMVFGARSMQDRRQDPRFRPDSTLLVSLGTSQRGFLSDLSEGGMAFDRFLPQNANETIRLSFRLPDGCEVMEAKAEIVWTRDSRHRTGVRFIELSERTRRQLRQWLSARGFTLGADDLGNVPQQKALEGMHDLPANMILQTIGRVPPELGRAGVSSPQEQMSGYNTTYSPGLVLGVIVLCSAFAGLGYYLPNMLRGQQAAAQAPREESSRGLPAKSLDASLKPAAETERNRAVPQTPIEGTGFVLQLAAMTHRENADALVQTLRSKSFPAFVVAREGDPYYRVDVGPYPDAAYALSVKDKLKGGGFQTVFEKQLLATNH